MEPEVPKLGLWARQSKLTKGLVIASVIGLVIVGGVVAYNKFVRQPDVKKIPDNKDSETTENKNTDTKKEDTKKEEKSVVKDLYTLPNKGIGCSEVYSKHDGNYDYVKCNGIWYTKSKISPTNEATKGQYVDWTSLETNDVQTKLLNTRYP